jgi:hypothetical protein
MMLAILLELPLPKSNAFDIEYASVTQVALHPHLNAIELLNFTPWRDGIAFPVNPSPVGYDAGKSGGGPPQSKTLRAT